MALMHTKLFSFGYKYGFPGADAAWDVRFLPNPYYVPELKESTGLVNEVSGYVLDNGTARDFFGLFEPMLLSFLRNHEATGRDELRIAVGCTGGKHRSVAVVEYLRHFLNDQSIQVDVFHRDIDKE